MDFDGQSSVPFEAGKKVGGGRFTMERLLGRGGMGVVWLARDERLGESVALKFLSQELQADAKALEQMRLETLKSRKLSHPHIVRIHDFHQEAGEPVFISMEYVDGCTLNDLGARQPERFFRWESVWPWMLQLCEALAYAHSQQLIHRDLKPANIMIERGGELKLSDFGISAAAADTVSRLTHQRKTSGTPAYMSPQQMEGRSPRVSDDIYSFGCVLYELLTSSPPFFRGDIWRQVQSKAAEPMAERMREFAIENPIPESVASLVMACLEKDSELRPQTIQEARERLDRSSDVAQAGEKAEQISSERIRRFPLALIAAGAIALALIVWGAIWMQGRAPESGELSGADSASETVSTKPAFTLSDEALLKLQAPNRGRRDPVDVPGPGVEVTFNIASGQMNTYSLQTGIARGAGSNQFARFGRFGLKFTLLSVKGGRAGDLIVGTAVGITARTAKTKIGIVSLAPGSESATIFADLNTEDVGVLGFTAREGGREWGKKSVTVTLKVEPVAGLETYPFESGR